MRVLLCFIGLVALISNSHAQRFITGNSPKDNSVFSYFVGTSEPPSNWKETTFDDSQWESDTLPMGYGHENFLRPIDKTAKSLYMRYRFTAQQPLIQTASLAPLFDDGFIVYLNGSEVLRYNMDKNGDLEPYNKLANRSHEQSWNGEKDWWDWDVFFLDTAHFGKYLREGENILAIQVHNDSLSGSDLGFSLISLSAMDIPFGNLYTLENRAHRHIDLDSSEFPIISIETNEYGIPRSAKNVEARMTVIEAEGYTKPSMTEKINTKISIEVHGQSSADFAKRSYEFELKDENNKDTSFALLGMPSGEDWILYAPYNDKSLIRNDIAFELGRSMGHYEPRTRKCELILNGEYRGLYVLTERIKRGKNRVNVSKLDSTETSPEGITGGYIVKYDKGLAGLQFIYPKSDKVSAIQKEYLNSFYNNLAIVRKSVKVADTVEGYHHYIDPNSLIDYVIINEFIRGSDSYKYSTYMYKDRNDKDGRIHFGPLWDSDLTFGVSNFQSANKVNGWQFAVNTDLGITRYLADTNFKKAFIARWKELRQTTFSKDAIIKLIDDKIAELKTGKDRNYRVWPLLKINYFGATDLYDYKETIAAMKTWTEQRGTWIDENITKINYKMPTDVELLIENNKQLYVYPSQFSSNFTVAGVCNSNGKVTVTLVSSQGQEIETLHEGDISSGVVNIPCSLSVDKAKGLYFVRVAINNEMVQSIPCFVQ